MKDAINIINRVYLYRIYVVLIFMLNHFPYEIIIETNISSPNAPMFVLTFRPYSQL